MVLKSLQVGNIADVIAHARLSDVVPVELASRPLLDALNRLQN